jgi:CheY-like chemotaxis protein
MGQSVIRGKAILLAEDEPAVREAYEMLLTLDGHAVTETADGLTAWETFKQNHFDLVITDLEMPRMKGDELASRIKQAKPAQPILMITAHPVGPEVPVDAVLNKPFSLDELRTVLARLMGGQT